MNREDADCLAKAAAGRAFECPDSLPLSLGVSLVGDCPGWMVLWSKPLSEPRPWEQEEVRRRLKEAGVEELACATYPAAGEPLHAYAMVLKADADRYALLAGIVRDVVRDNVQRLKAILASLPRGVG